MDSRKLQTEAVLCAKFQSRPFASMHQEPKRKNVPEFRGKTITVSTGRTELSGHKHCQGSIKFIPKKSTGKKGKKVMNLNATLGNIITANLEGHLTPCLWGEAGIGKSSWVKDLARSMKTKSFTLTCNLLAEKADLTGARLIPSQKEGQYEQQFFPHATISEAIAYADDHPDETPLLFMDEFNRANEDVVSGVLSLITERRIGNAVLPDNLRIIAAGNDRGNISCLDSASVSRFINYKIKPDLQTFFHVNPNLHPSIKTVLKKEPSLIVCYQSDTSESYDNDDSMIFTTPRTICALSDLLSSLDPKVIIRLLKEKYTTDCGETDCRFNEIVYAHVGKTKFAAMFLIQFAKDCQAKIDQAANCITRDSVEIEKPEIYDRLCSLKTRDELCDCLDTLSNSDLLDLLLFCLFDDSRNNDAFIIPAAERAKLDARSETLQRIGEYMGKGLLCKEHVAKLMSADTPLTPYVSHYNNPTHFFSE